MKAITGTGVVHCDGDTVWVSPSDSSCDSLLNIYPRNRIGTRTNMPVGILLGGTHLNIDKCRLGTANRPLAINNREWHSGYTLCTCLGYLVVNPRQALVGFQEVQCLGKEVLILAMFDSFQVGLKYSERHHRRR